MDTWVQGSPLCFLLRDINVLGLWSSLNSYGYGTKYGLKLVISLHAHLITVLCIVALHKYCFLQSEGRWWPCTKQFFWCHFSNSICSLCVSVSHFGNSFNISNFFVIIFVMMMCLQWSLKKWCYSFIYFWLCRVFIAAWVFSSCGEWGLLIAVATFVAEHGL